MYHPILQAKETDWFVLIVNYKSVKLDFYCSNPWISHTEIHLTPVFFSRDTGGQGRRESHTLILLSLEVKVPASLQKCWVHLPITLSTIWYCLFSSEASSCWQLKYSTSSGDTLPSLDAKEIIKKKNHSKASVIMLMEATYRNSTLYSSLYGSSIWFCHSDKSLKQTTAYMTFLKALYNYKPLLRSKCHRCSYCLPVKWRYSAARISLKTRIK